MEFSRQEYWSGLPFPSPGDLPNPEIKPRFPTLQAGSLLSEPPGKPKNTGVGSHSFLQGDPPDPGIKPGSAALQVNSLPVDNAPNKLIQYHISVFIFVSQGTKACKQASKLEGESR